MRWVRCLRGVRAYSAREDVKAQQETLISGYMLKKGKGGLGLSGLTLGFGGKMTQRLDKGGDKTRWCEGSFGCAHGSAANFCGAVGWCSRVMGK